VLQSDIKRAARQGEAGQIDMVWFPGRTFRSGSNQHYPEEAPVHRVTVDGFWIDRAPVTSRQFKSFVKATGHKTFAEIPPDPKDYGRRSKPSGRRHQQAPDTSGTGESHEKIGCFVTRADLRGDFSERAKPLTG
jgi:formylglycine-generating enzyme required for sulfatase activity